MKFFSSLVCLLLVAPLTLSAAVVNGKANVAGEPVPGVEVLAYPISVLNLNHPAAHRSGVTAADGLFHLDLPAGEYYLLAKGEKIYSFYGRNPVAVPEGGLNDVNLLMLPEKLPVPDVPSDVEAGVAGFVSIDGRPVADARVIIYTDLSSRLKGMGLSWTSPTDTSGYFEAPLPAGSYYLIVRVRQDGQMAGPLKAGDLFGYLSGNPLTVKEDELSRVHIPLIELPEKVERHADSLFGNTLVTGRVINTQGQPVAGLRVLLYEDPMMLNRPLYVSPTTSADGFYQLSFPAGGRYFLAARNELGGTPAPGELYGRYQGSPDHSINIETGKVLESIEIVVDEVY